MVQKFPLYFPEGQEDRTIHLYLPDEYDYSDSRYPVLYMFDGHNLFFDADATYGKSWGIKDFLDHWDKPVIVVGMECSHHGFDRIREYCPYDIYSRFAGGRIHGTGGQTMRWVIEDVKPYIDSHFRTWPHREATAIGGSSMGGMMALYAVIRHNDVFSKGACVSNALSGSMPALRQELAEQPVNPDTRAFLSSGTEESFGQMDRANREIAGILSSQGAAA